MKRRVPQPKTEYLQQSEQLPQRKSTPGGLLLVLDLNGTLFNKERDNNRVIVKLRPGLHEFMKIATRNHVAVIWTGSPLNSAKNFINTYLKAYKETFVCVMTREDFDLTTEERDNPVTVFKNLEKVWENEKVQQTADPGQKWDQTNTVLIDDTELKASAQPHNLLLIKEYNPGAERDDKELRRIIKAIAALQHEEDVSRCLRDGRIQRTSARAPGPDWAPWLTPIPPENRRTPIGTYDKPPEQLTHWHYANARTNPFCAAAIAWHASEDYFAANHMTSAPASAAAPPESQAANRGTPAPKKPRLEG